MKQFLDRLAVCSWSLQPSDPQALVEAARALGLTRIQCAIDPLRETPGVWGNLGELCRKEKLTLISGMFVTAGEDYSSLESIRSTGGIVPDSTWDENFENIQADATIAQQLGLPLVTFHAGFLPHDEHDPAYEVLLHRVRLVADLFAAKSIDLALETGQEDALTLKRFLEKLGRVNVGVNFDPANMLLYDKGNPIEALRILGPWLRQCHLKDAHKTATPGTWGTEMPVGQGEVNWPDFFQALVDLKYEGFCSFEREAGHQRLEDIRSGKSSSSNSSTVSPFLWSTLASSGLASWPRRISRLTAKSPGRVWPRCAIRAAGISTATCRVWKAI